MAPTAVQAQPAGQTSSGIKNGCSVFFRHRKTLQQVPSLGQITDQSARSFSFKKPPGRNDHYSTLPNRRLYHVVGKGKAMVNAIDCQGCVDGFTLGRDRSASPEAE